MIYVTVGTHDQPFTRLVKAMDEIAAEIEERVIIQRGSSPYTPRHAEYVDIVSREEAEAYMREARLVVAQGGCGTVLTAIQMGKPLIVVPRRREYHEHIDDHQVEFARAMEGRKGIRVVYDEKELVSAMDFGTAPTPNPLRENLLDAVRQYLDGLAQRKAPRKLWPAAALFAILLLTMALRLWGIGWGLPNGQTRSVSYHPDENTYLHLIATVNPSRRDFVIDSWGQAFVPYALAGLMGAADHVGWFELQTSESFYIDHPAEAAKIYLLGRSISIVSGTLSVLLIYAVVRKVFPDAPSWLAPLAALFLAVAPGHVLNCHYLETDVPVTFFILLTMYCLVDLVKLGRSRDYLFAGACAGLAIGTKWSALPLLLLLPAAHCIRRPMWWRPRNILDRESLKRMALLILALALAFLLTNPYVLEQPQVVAGGVGEMTTSMFSSAARETLVDKVITLLGDTIPTSLGWGPYLAGCIGLFAVIMDRRRFPIETLSVLWVVVFGAIAINTYSATIGRTMPLLPFLILLAASALVRLHAWTIDLRLKRAVTITWGVLSVGLALGMAVVFDLFFCCADTARQDASRWIEANVPRGTTFGLYLQEPYWDDPDILYQDFYHPGASGARYQYAIYLLDADIIPPPPDYLIFTDRDERKIQDVLESEEMDTLLDWMKEKYQVAAEFESVVSIAGLEFRGTRWFFATPHIQIMKLKESR